MELHLFGSKVLSLVARTLGISKHSSTELSRFDIYTLSSFFLAKTLYFYELLPSLYQYQTIVASVILLLPNKIGEEISWY